MENERTHQKVSLERSEKEQLKREERHQRLIKAKRKKGETVEKLTCTQLRYDNYQKTDQNY